MFLLGHWKNFDQLEEELTIEELSKILEAVHKREERTMKFQASLQGINLDEGKTSKFDEIKERAQRKIDEENAKKHGSNAEGYHLAKFGIAIESE